MMISYLNDAAVGVFAIRTIDLHLESAISRVTGRYSDFEEGIA